ncbi:ABC-F family ATP-binding cassette domain-containing protein [Limosilactobacillus secaliphilus]|uniref:ABC transporter ATP-binding component n=1 Tax=Limosilactobacillus secaliphilus TaxID=396268 RepID=A0A0R2I129_9LACO|nr:ABC-F family ATP-binding cassette domain-containing protein [Limosilactobacillus secaliphilus]KRN58866.1 ABC transporter ATP-binding component [Limosilactobacillus secaliphilus]
MQTLRADNLTSIYGEKTLFKNVSVIVNENDRIGLIGVNGSGKTSLLNVLSGETSADSGEITKPNDYTIGYLKQKPVLDPNKTIMDAVFSGDQLIFATIRKYEEALQAFSDHPEDNKAADQFTKMQGIMDQQDLWDADSQVKTILTQLKINDWQQKIGTLSGGQQKRVGLAQVLIQHPDLLLLDEPTNQLDISSIEWLQTFLNGYRGAVIVITHDRYFLDQVTNHIWELSFGTLYHYDGNYQDFLQQKAEREELATEAERKRQALYKKELAWMRHGAKARSTKQKGRINRFNELKGQVGKLQTEGNVEINLGSTRLGKDVINVKDANLAFGKHQILKDFNWLVQPGDRIGISGENGAGKTTLLNVIAGHQKLDSGVIKIGETVKIGYYTQQTEPIDDSKRVINYLTDVADTVKTASGEKISVTNLLEQFLFPRFMHGTLIRKLSGGEKRRLYLLKILMQQPNVLLLDEPTNDLDINTLEVLEDYLDDFDGTVITVSHDRYFLNRVADSLLIFKGNGVIQPYTGLFTDYLKQSEQQAKSAKTQEKNSKKAEQPKPAASSTQSTKKKTKLTYAEQLEFNHLDDDLDKLDAQQKDLESQMAANGDNYVKLAELQKKLNSVQKQVDEKTKRWEYLSNFVD